MSDFTFDQLSLAVQDSARLGFESGQESVRKELADYFDKLAVKDCFTPDFSAIARDIRSGVIGGRAEPDLGMVDLSNADIVKGYRLALSNVQVEIRNAIARENLRCRTVLRLVQKKWESVGLGVRAELIGSLISQISQVSND